jgi:hypothetical protein
MTDRHIRNSARMCESLSKASNSSSDSEKWDSWVSIFEEEIWRRSNKKKSPTMAARKVPVKQTPKTIGSTVKLKCHCSAIYNPRVADLKRGWGLSCCKRCASIKREYGRPDPVCAETGVNYKKIIK